MVENPYNSWIWYMPDFVELLDAEDAFDVEYHACMVGGSRNKRQRLRANATELRILDQRWCDGSHKHLPWTSGGSLHHSEEAEYPQQMCEEIASQFVKVDAHVGAAARHHGIASGALAASKRKRQRREQPRKAHLGKQVGARQPERTVAEYKAVHITGIPASDAGQAQQARDSDKGWLSESLVVGNACIPSGSRILRVHGESGQESGQAEVQWGVPWTAEEFMEEARKQTHPFDGGAVATDRIKHAIFLILTTGPEETKSRRRRALARWWKRAKELEEKEKREFGKAPEEVQACWRGKRTNLLCEMAAEAGMPNPELIKSYLQQGAPVFGEVPASGLYESEESLPDKTFEQALKASRWSIPVLQATTRPGRAEVDKEVYERTQQEVAEGKAKGPYTKEEMDQLLGRWWSPARRVGLEQTSGVRPIDDFSEFGQNGTSWTHELVDLGTTDVIAGIAKEWHQAVQADGRVEIEDSLGQRLVGYLHPDFVEPASRNIVGRTVDLKRAFKQVAVAKSMLPLTAVCIWHPIRKEPVFYVLHALPFGARNSVFIFGQIARTIELIMANLFDVLTAQYVDDYPQLEPAVLVDGPDVMLEVFEILGWEVKEVEGRKPSFCDKFVLLGVVFDLSDVCTGKLTVRNKEDRAAKVEKEVAAIIDAGVVRPAATASLRGALNFARSQCFGRCGGAALATMARLEKFGAARVGVEEVEALQFWPRFLRAARPREVLFRDTRLPVLLFTDGAEEDGLVGVGGVIEDRHTAKREYFGGKVQQEVIEEWKAAGGKSKVIHQAELLPAVLAIKMWGEAVAGRRVILYVDNDTALSALVKGTSTSLPSARLTNSFWELVAKYGLFIWIDRVPSVANPADAPSRGCGDALMSEGYNEVLAPGLLSW